MTELFLKLTLGVFIALLFQTCENKDCCTPLPVEAQFDGNWELIKVTNGFAQIELEGAEIGFTEELNFDIKKGNFTRKRNAKEVLKSKFEIGTEANQDAILLKDDQSYHWYSFIEVAGSPVLVLYENCPIGAILADGSYYEYRKVD